MVLHHADLLQALASLTYPRGLLTMCVGATVDLNLYAPFPVTHMTASVPSTGSCCSEIVARVPRHRLTALAQSGDVEVTIEAQCLVLRGRRYTFRFPHTAFRPRPVEKVTDGFAPPLFPFQLCDDRPVVVRATGQKITLESQYNWGGEVREFSASSNQAAGTLTALQFKALQDNLTEPDARMQIAGTCIRVSTRSVSALFRMGQAVVNPALPKLVQLGVFSDGEMPEAMNLPPWTDVCRLQHLVQEVGAGVISGSYQGDDAYRIVIDSQERRFYMDA